MSVTDEIKARLDIVNFLSQYIQLKKAGRNYTGLCPFHAEKTPSFVVFPESQNWRCFGACGEGGDIFNFVMKHDGLDFVSALKVLADKAGVELQERTPEQVKGDEHLDKMRGLLDETARYFHEQLMESAEAQPARTYVRKRGLKRETLVSFRIGYAPDNWQEALDHLKTLGYTEDEIVEAGVAIRNEERGRVYDRFRNRLVIPICDGRGQIIGFGARALDPDDNPKYLNSPQTPLFDKGATLFGLHMARRTIRESETAVIVEGYMDAIQAHQAGFTNVVAQMGTALTESQLKQLSRYARRLILALDADAAGVRATMRGLDVARQTLAQPVVDYVIEVGTSHLTTKSTFGDREASARELLPILLATENDLQQHYNVQRLALKLHLDERTLIQWAQQQRRSARVITKDRSRPQAQPAAQPADGQAESTQPPSIPAQGSAMERYCISILMQKPRLWSMANRRMRQIAGKKQGVQRGLGPLSSDDFFHSDFRAIINLLEKALAQDDMEPIDYLEEHLPYELRVEVERLLSEPIAAYKQQQLSQMLERERAKIAQLVLRTSDEFLQHVLNLRKQRLIRENQNLYFLLQEADSDTGMQYHRQYEANRRALLLIDQTINQMTEMQRTLT